MSQRHEHDPDEATPELERALDAWAADAAAPARPQFKERLRGAFLDVVEAASGERVAPPARVDRPRIERPRRGAASPRRAGRPTGAPLRLLGALGGVAAAAALVFLIVRSSLDPGEEAPIGPLVAYAPRWEVLDGSSGTVRVGAAPFDLDGGGRDAVPGALKVGARVSVPEEARLLLRLDDRVVFQLAAGTALVLDRLPAPSAGEPMLLVAESGHLSAATGPRFAETGSRLTVRSRDADVEVVGTSFAIDVYDSGTCICCTHGQVRVLPVVESCDPADVGAGRASFVHREDPSTSAMPAMEAHVADLATLEAFWR